jgi:hypothetical protein
LFHLRRRAHLGPEPPSRLELALCRGRVAASPRQLGALGVQIGTSYWRACLYADYPLRRRTP